MPMPATATNGTFAKSDVQRTYSSHTTCPKCGKAFYGKKRRCYKCVPGGRKSQITTLPVSLAPMRGPGPSAATIARVEECRRLENISAAEHEATVKANAAAKAEAERRRVREERRDAEIRIRKPVLTAAEAVTATCPQQNFVYTLPPIDPCGGPCSPGFAVPTTLTVTNGDGTSFVAALADVAPHVEALAASPKKPADPAVAALNAAMVAPLKKPGDPVVAALNAAMVALSPLSPTDRARVMKCLAILVK